MLMTKFETTTQIRFWFINYSQKSDSDNKYYVCTTQLKLRDGTNSPFSSKKIRYIKKITKDCMKLQ